MLRPSTEDQWAIGETLRNKAFLNDFNALVDKFPNEMERVVAPPEVQFSIYFPLYGIQESRKAKFIEAVELFFKRHYPLPLSRDNNYLYICFLVPKSKEQKLFIMKFQNCLNCWQQKKPIKEKAFTQGAFIGTFDFLPPEVAANISFFATRREGGRLACVAKKPAHLAKAEEANAENLIRSTTPNLI